MFLHSYRFHQTVSAASLLAVVRTELGRDSKGGVGSIRLPPSTSRGSRVPSRTGVPDRRRHSNGTILFVPDAHTTSPCCSLLLYQDKGSVEETTPSRAGVRPRCCWTRGRSCAAATRIITAVSLRAKEGQKKKSNIGYVQKLNFSSPWNTASWETELLASSAVILWSFTTSAPERPGFGFWSWWWCCCCHYNPDRSDPFHIETVTTVK